MVARLERRCRRCSIQHRSPRSDPWDGSWRSARPHARSARPHARSAWSVAVGREHRSPPIQAAVELEFAASARLRPSKTETSHRCEVSSLSRKSGWRDLNPRPFDPRTCHRAVHPEVGRQAAEARDALRLGGEVLAAHVRADLVAHHVAERVVGQVQGVRDHVLVRGEDAVRSRAEIALEMRFPEIVGDAQDFGAQLGGRGGRVAARKASTDSNPNAAPLSRGGVRSRARFSATGARLPPTASAACPPTARRAQSAPARQARGRFGNRCRRDTKSN
jgi:hypothetical protein